MRCNIIVGLLTPKLPFIVEAPLSVYEVPFIENPPVAVIKLLPSIVGVFNSINVNVYVVSSIVGILVNETEVIGAVTFFIY